MGERERFFPGKSGAVLRFENFSSEARVAEVRRGATIGPVERRESFEFVKP